MLWFICQLMMYRNVIVSNAISCSLFVFTDSQFCVKVSGSLTTVGSLAVGGFDLLVNYSLSVVWFVPLFNIGQ